MTIIRIQPSDLPVLCTLAERSFRDAWQDDNAPEDFETYCRKHFSKENMSDELAQPGAEFYFALLNEQPVAYLKLNIDRNPNAVLLGEEAGKSVQLVRIYVLQGFQGQRIGEALLRFSEARAKEENARWLWLTVWQKAPRTIRFYEKNGFEIFGVETFWLGNDAQPDWLMRKSLADDMTN